MSQQYLLTARFFWNQEELSKKLCIALMEVSSQKEAIQGIFASKTQVCLLEDFVFLRFLPVLAKRLRCHPILVRKAQSRLHIVPLSSMEKKKSYYGFRSKQSQDDLQCNRIVPPWCCRSRSGKYVLQVWQDNQTGSRIWVFQHLKWQTSLLVSNRFFLVQLRLIWQGPSKHLSSLFVRELHRGWWLSIEIALDLKLLLLTTFHQSGTWFLCFCQLYRQTWLYNQPIHQVLTSFLVTRVQLSWLQPLFLAEWFQLYP